jgi:RNA polymerase sigma factor (sigma-70 family)
MPDGAGSVTQFFDQFRAGDSVAAGRLWERFFPRLLALARRTLAGRPQGPADADDAVQSAFVSFWQRARSGDFGPGLGRDDLWNLLGFITVRKAMRHQRRERAAKRGGGKVVGEAALGRDASPGLDAIAGGASAAEFDLTCEELLGKLDDELRQFAVLRLLGYKNREIAEMHNCTERRIERKLALIRQQWENEGK